MSRYIKHLFLIPALHRGVDKNFDVFGQIFRKCSNQSITSQVANLNNAVVCFQAYVFASTIISAYQLKYIGGHWLEDGMNFWQLSKLFVDFAFHELNKFSLLFM